MDPKRRSDRRCFEIPGEAEMANISQEIYIREKQVFLLCPLLRAGHRKLPKMD
jgi:hypothetical protein